MYWHPEGVSGPPEGDVNMKQNNRLTGRRIGAAAVLTAVTTCGGLALAPAAFADSTAASATTHSATHSAAAHPETAAQCYQMLIIYGYTVTAARGLACNIAAAGKPNHQAALAACFGIMTGTLVSVPVATIACATGASEG
jgi:hypothetical protein